MRRGRAAKAPELAPRSTRAADDQPRFDHDGPEFVGRLGPEAVQQQLTARYEELFRIFWNRRDKIDRVTFWGTHDGNNWKNGYPVPRRTNYPMLFDRARQPKPAFDAVMAIPQGGAAGTSR